MHPQQVVKMQKYHHGQCTEEVRVRRVERRQSKDEEDECERQRARMRVGLRLRRCMCRWCCVRTQSLTYVHDTHPLVLTHTKSPTWLPRSDRVFQSLSWSGQVDRDTTIAVLQCRFSRCRAHVHPVTHPTPVSITSTITPHPRAPSTLTTTVMIVSSFSTSPTFAFWRRRTLVTPIQTTTC